MGEMIKRGIFMHVAIAIVCALSAFVGSAVAGIAISALLYVAYVAMMYAEGTQVGEHHCTVSDTLDKLAKENKKADEKLQSNAYSPQKGIIACAVLAAPSLILAVLNILTADPTTSVETTIGVVTRIWYLPAAFITRWCNDAVKTDISGAVAATKAVLGAFDYNSLDLKALLDETSKVGVYAYAYDLSPLTLMRILYIPAGLLPPLAMLIGYLQGPRLRAKTVKDMLSGSRKKQRKMRRGSKPRQPRQAKPEV